MPLYEYQCESCGGRFEVIQKFSDTPVEACKACGGGPVLRLPSAPAIQFKGSGWYITDYARKGNGSETPASSPAGATSSSSNGAATEAGSSKPASDSSNSTSTPTPTAPPPASKP